MSFEHAASLHRISQIRVWLCGNFPGENLFPREQRGHRVPLVCLCVVKMHSSDSRRSPTKLFSQRVQLVLCLALVCFLSVLVLESHGAASDYMDDDGVNTPSSYSGQYEDLNYYDDYDVYSAGYHYDDKSDDGGEDYFNQYTGGYDDVDGDYFFEDYETTTEDCTVGPDGEVTSKTVQFWGFCRFCCLRLTVLEQKESWRRGDLLALLFTKRSLTFS